CYERSIAKAGFGQLRKLFTLTGRKVQLKPHCIIVKVHGESARAENYIENGITKIYLFPPHPRKPFTKPDMPFLSGACSFSSNDGSST
uniref:Uncharacterized protein n=1 Tax=Glossina palpalis gambiensis TaxID=67801 RepID=A0A1B0B186_9MUSC